MGMKRREAPRKCWTFFVPIDIPSGNVLKRRWYAGDRRHYKRFKRDFAWGIVALGRDVPRVRPGVKRYVAVERVFSGRKGRYEYDNLVMGAKPVVDGLVNAGLIEDDKAEDVVVTYHQTPGGDGGVRIWIYERE